ncbi:uncharacterized, partial [Tachysurus ichikawai]
MSLRAPFKRYSSFLTRHYHIDISSVGADSRVHADFYQAARSLYDGLFSPAKSISLLFWKRSSQPHQPNPLYYTTDIQ